MTSKLKKISENLKKNQNYKHFKLDLLNKEKLSKIFSLHKPSVVVHLA